MKSLERLENRLSELNITIKIDQDARNYSISFQDGLGFMHVSTNTHQLQHLRISEELQNKGLASLLVEVAKEVGATELTAQKCDEGLSQKDLVKFYEKHGFVAYFQDENLAAMELA